MLPVKDGSTARPRPCSDHDTLERLLKAIERGSLDEPGACRTVASRSCTSRQSTQTLPSQPRKAICTPSSHAHWRRLVSAMLFFEQKDAAPYTDRSEKHKLSDGRFNALSKAARAQLDKAGLSCRNFMKAWQADQQMCPATIYLSQTTARA